MKASRHILLVSLGLPAACGANGHPGAHAGGPSSAPSASLSASPSARLAPRMPCERAADFVARVPTLLNEGKLRRAQRVLAKADALCPDVHAGHADVDALILAELGRIQDADNAIAGIEACQREG